MKNKLYFFVIFLAVFMSGCSQSINLEKSNPIGKLYVGSIDLGDMNLPLPDGEWKIVGRGYSNKNNFFEVYLEKDIGNKPLSIILIRRETLSIKPYGYYADEYLTRDDIHHVVSNKNIAGGAQDGWIINHIRFGFGSHDPKADKELYRHIRDNKLVIPGNFILTYHHFTGALRISKFLDYYIYVNPEAEGFDPPNNANWSSSDWNPAKINNDSKKVEYIERLKKEGAVFHKELKAAFGK